MELHYEDLSVGQRHTCGSVRVEEADIIAFARQFDPQPFHTDPAAAASSAFGGLVASGWHTAALTMRMMVGGEMRFAGGAIGRRVEALEWPRPVRPGDTLSVVNEILHLRPMRSRATHGVIRLRTTTTNQRGEIVQTMESIVLVQRRTRTDPAGTSEVEGTTDERR